MSIIIRFVLIGLVCLLAGWAIGRSSGVAAQAEVQKNKSMDELKLELKSIETSNILRMLKTSAEVKQVDEGGLFSKKIVTYLHAEVTNTAAVATATDVKLTIDFLSKADAEVGRDEVMISDFILPYHTHRVKRKINWPAEAARYRLSVDDARVN
jgi:hypothetical protein